MKRNKESLHRRWWALNPRQCYDWRSSGRKNLTWDMGKFANAAIIETNRTDTYHERLFKTSTSSRRLRVALQQAWDPYLSPPRTVKFYGSASAEPLAKGYVYPDLLVVKRDGTMDGEIPPAVDLIKILEDRKRKSKDDELCKQFASALVKIQGLPGAKATPQTKNVSDNVHEALDHLVDVSLFLKKLYCCSYYLMLCWRLGVFEELGRARGDAGRNYTPFS